MAELPIMPLKTDALLADTTHMSAEEMGAYCRVLFVMWRHEARLQDNPVELSRIAGVTLKRWGQISERVMRPLTAAGGIVSQKRLTSTWLDVQELRKKRAHAAEARWKSKRHANGHAHALQLDAGCNANQISKKERASSMTPRRVAESEAEQDNSAADLASALPAGALARPPDDEPVAPKRLSEAPPERASRALMEEIYEARRKSAETTTPPAAGNP